MGFGIIPLLLPIFGLACLRWSRRPTSSLEVELECDAAGRWCGIVEEVDDGPRSL